VIAYYTSYLYAYMCTLLHIYVYSMVSTILKEEHSNFLILLVKLKATNKLYIYIYLHYLNYY